MIKEQMNKIKEILKQSNDNNNKRKTENLVVFVIILIITIIIINMILKTDKKDKTNDNIVSTKALAKTQIDSTINQNLEENDLQTSLENILSNIEGVGKTKVLITYSQTSQSIPLYNEDSSFSDTEEKDTSGGSRKISENVSKKEIIYQEINGEKVPVTQSTVNPKIEGAIILAKGATNSEIRLKITQAVEAATGVATHKIQVFPLADKE